FRSGTLRRCSLLRWLAFWVSGACAVGKECREKRKENIQHPTSNIQRRKLRARGLLDVERWMLDVGCSGLCPSGLQKSDPTEKLGGTPETLRATVVFNATGVASGVPRGATTPLGLFAFAHFSQGSSFLATLGFKLESLRDSFPEFRPGIGFGA